MSIPEILTAAGNALDLILSFPGHWLLFIVAFVVIAEALMFVPYVGFTLKMIVATLIGAHSYVLFQDAAAGVRPDLAGIFGAFSLPLMAQTSIVLSGIIPFFIGVLYLQLTGGWPATRFFFGNILKEKPPEASQFERFKYVMQFSAIPFTFVAPLVVLGGVHDSTALVRGVLLGLHHWPILLLLLGISLFAEWGNARMTSGLPKKYALPILGVSMVAFIAWGFSFGYTLYAAIGSVTR
jgi:hypothetical protein